MDLFRTILVPHDFSEHASRALAVAAELAQRHDGRLIVLHAIVPFTPVSGLPMAEPPILLVPPADLVADGRRQLERMVSRTLGRRRVRVECRVEIGDPFQTIIAAARGASAIVMSTLGRTGLAHLVMGSVAEKVVRHAPVPVLTLRGGAAPERRARPVAAPARRTAASRRRR